MEAPGAKWCGFISFMMVGSAFEATPRAAGADRCVDAWSLRRQRACQMLLWAVGARHALHFRSNLVIRDGFPPSNRCSALRRAKHPLVSPEMLHHAMLREFAYRAIFTTGPDRAQPPPRATGYALLHNLHSARLVSPCRAILASMLRGNLTS